MIDGLKKAIEIIETQMESNLDAFRGQMYSHVVNEPIESIRDKLKSEIKRQSLTDDAPDTTQEKQCHNSQT